MTDPFVAEIRIFTFNFAPQGWAFCNGQILPISQNTALFSLLGTTYGGDGRTTFGLPNLQGSVAIQPGQGPGLSDYVLGQTGGAAAVTLIETEVPTHTHTMRASSALSERSFPADNAYGVSDGENLYSTSGDGLIAMNSAMLAPAGNSAPHNNLMPYLALNYCIALQGIYPPRG